MNKRAGALPDRQRPVVDIFTEKPEKLKWKKVVQFFFLPFSHTLPLYNPKTWQQKKTTTKWQASAQYLPASSEIPTRQGLLADITSAQIFSKSKGVDKHSSPPK